MDIESVDAFKYPGSTLTQDNIVKREILERIGTGNRCTFAYNNILKSRLISRRTKLRIYNVIIRPTVLYGSECWTLTKETMRKLEVFENSILRRILGPVFNPDNRQWERRHNADIRTITNQPYLQNVVRSRRLRWAGHCARMQNDRIPKIVMNGTVLGRRPVGRPRYRWRDGVQIDVHAVAPRTRDWQATANDRRLWRGLGKAVMGLQAREPHE